jgi:hypothetical protein
MPAAQRETRTGGRVVRGSHQRLCGSQSIALKFCPSVVFSMPLCIPQDRGSTQERMEGRAADHGGSSLAAMSSPHGGETFDLKEFSLGNFLQPPLFCRV